MQCCIRCVLYRLEVEAPAPARAAPRLSPELGGLRATTHHTPDRGQETRANTIILKTLMNHEDWDPHQITSK